MRISIPYFLTASAGALLIAAPAFSQGKDNVELRSETKVVRTVVAADGTETTVKEDPKTVVPGDRLVFTHFYSNLGSIAATDFVLNNPLPEAVAYRGSDDDNVFVSVDAGKTFGKLETLKVTAEDGTIREATQDDVTNVRWVFSMPIPSGAKGSVGFAGEVR